MRTRRLFVLTLVVLLLHAIGWRLASGGAPRFDAARLGLRTLASVSVPMGARVPFTLVEPTPKVDAPTRSATRSTKMPVPVPVPESVLKPLHARSRASPAAGRPRTPVAPAPRLPAGDGGSRPADTVAAAAWPVYATRPPVSVTLHYALVQRTHAAASAATEGLATLEWTNAGTAFTLRLATAVEGHPPRDWESTGGFDAAGVAPLRLVERERGRDRRSINFDRDAARVRFSGAPGAPSTAPGAQDRWSWVAQLAAIAEDGARRGQLAGPWHLQVAGLRGDLDRWTFRVLPPGEPPPELRPQGNELSASGDRAPALLHVLRATERPYDLRIEAWLSPSLHHFPAGLRLSTPPGPWSLSLWQQST
jgi:hypothetical protein